MVAAGLLEEPEGKHKPSLCGGYESVKALRRRSQSSAFDVMLFDLEVRGPENLSGSPSRMAFGSLKELLLTDLWWRSQHWHGTAVFFVGKTSRSWAATLRKFS